MKEKPATKQPSPLPPRRVLELGEQFRSCSPRNLPSHSRPAIPLTLPSVTGTDVSAGSGNPWQSRVVQQVRSRSSGGIRFCPGSSGKREETGHNLAGVYIRVLQTCFRGDLSTLTLYSN